VVSSKLLEKETRLKSAILNDEVYGSRIIFLWNADSATLAAHVKNLFDTGYDDAADFKARCWEITECDPHTVIIMLPEWRGVWTPDSISMLVHELFHAVEYILAFHDVDHGEGLSEPWAYYLDSLVRRAMEVLPLTSAFNATTELPPKGYTPFYVRCGKCGEYVPGHATGGDDICTCKREP
jgi:hypothetical protein